MEAVSNQLAGGLENRISSALKRIKESAWLGEIFSKIFNPKGPVKTFEINGYPTDFETAEPLDKETAETIEALLPVLTKTGKVEINGEYYVHSSYIDHELKKLHKWIKEGELALAEVYANKKVVLTNDDGLAFTVRLGELYKNLLPPSEEEFRNAVREIESGEELEEARVFNPVIASAFSPGLETDDTGLEGGGSLAELPVSKIDQALSEIESKKPKKKKTSTKIKEWFKAPELSALYIFDKYGRKIAIRWTAKEIGDRKEFETIEEMLNITDLEIAHGTALEQFYKEGRTGVSVMEGVKEEIKEHKTTYFTRLFAEGEYVSAILIYRHYGKDIKSLSDILQKEIEKFEDKNKNILQNWDGNQDAFKKEDIDGIWNRLKKEFWRNKYVKRPLKGLAYFGIPLLFIGGAWYGATLNKSEPSNFEPVKNYPPEFNGIQNTHNNITTGVVGEPLEFKVSFIDLNNDKLTFGAYFKENGTAIPIDENGWIRFDKIPEDWVGEHVINVSASDGQNTTYKEIVLKILPANQPPYITYLDVQKTSSGLKVRTEAKDNDTGVAGLEFLIDGKVVSQAAMTSYDGEIDLSALDLSPGKHKIEVRAIDLKDHNLKSEIKEAYFELSGDPQIADYSVVQKEDLVELNLKTLIEAGELEKAVFQLENIYLEENLSGKEQKINFTFNTDGMSPDKKVGKLIIYTKEGFKKEIEVPVVPYDDPVTANLQVASSGGDKFMWTLTAEDEESLINYAKVWVEKDGNLTEILTNSSFDNKRQLGLTGELDLAEKEPGAYSVHAQIYTTSGQGVLLQKNITAEDNPPEIYAWSVSKGPANEFSVNVSGKDLDNKVDEAEIVVEKEDGEIIYQKNFTLNSKEFSIEDKLNFANQTPGKINIKAYLKQAGNKIPVFNESREILNDIGIINSFNVYYDPVVQEFKISGNVSDVDTAFTKATYTLKEKESGILVQGELNAKDGEWDGKIETFWANISKSKFLPDGVWELNAVFYDEKGVPLSVYREVEANSSFEVIPMWSQDPDAKEPKAIWDEDEKTAYLLLLGNNTLLEEKLNDFESIATPKLVEEVKKNYTLYLNASDPFETMKQIHQNLIMVYSDGRNPQPGYEEDQQLAIDIRATFEYIKNQVLNNNSISKQDKEKWENSTVTLINHANNFNAALFTNYDGSEYFFAQIMNPFPRSSQSLTIMDYENFALHFGEDQAKQKVAMAIVDWRDNEWLKSKGNYTGLVEKIKFENSSVAKEIAELFDNQTRENRYKLDKLSATVLSIYKSALLGERDIYIGKDSENFVIYVKNS